MKPLAPLNPTSLTTQHPHHPSLRRSSVLPPSPTSPSLALWSSPTHSHRRATPVVPRPPSAVGTRTTAGSCGPRSCGLGAAFPHTWRAAASAAPALAKLPPGAPHRPQVRGRPRLHSARRPGPRLTATLPRPARTPGSAPSPSPGRNPPVFRVRVLSLCRVKTDAAALTPPPLLLPPVALKLLLEVPAPQLPAPGRCRCRGASRSSDSPHLSAAPLSVLHQPQIHRDVSETQIHKAPCPRVLELL